MMFMHLAAHAAAHGQSYSTYFDNPFSFNDPFSQHYAPPALPTVPALTQQARPPQTDETGANFADAALSYFVPAYPVVKAGAEVLDSPTAPGWLKAVVIGIGILALKDFGRDN